MTANIMKLVVGIASLQDYAAWHRDAVFDYHGDLAIPCWTRYAPKRADEILKSGGSIYRVMGGRFACRHKILGFEIVEDTPKGKMCMIVQSAQIIETVNAKKKAFQGWRYLKPSDAPADKGIYNAIEGDSIPDPEMESQLRAAGLL